MSNKGDRKVLKLFKAENERSETMTEKGHNINERIQELAVRYADCDRKSAELNDERAEIREEAADMGLDKKAWQNEINRAKQSLRHKEGYDESAQVIRDALGQMDMSQLWAHVEERKLKKEKEREEKKKAREAEKAKDDEFKPADERAPANEGQSVLDDEAQVA